MATFALIAEHPPDLCPTSNAQTRPDNEGGCRPDPATRRAEAVPELFERFGEAGFERLREALETSSSFPEAAPKMGDLGRWCLERASIPRSSSTPLRCRGCLRETGPMAIKGGSSSGEPG
jgi:hypothetical protein